MTDAGGRLPDGRSVRIAAEAADRLSCGVLVVDDVSVRENPDVWTATGRVGDAMRSEHAGLLPSQIPGLAEARRLYKSFGMDPSRHRPSSEALLRRVLKGKDLYHINNLVDTCNLASLDFLLPIGMYDLALILGDVTLRTGEEGDQYPGIRKGPVNLAGRLGLFDEQGPFGSPTSDSARTCTSEETRTVLAVVMATNTFPRESMRRHVASLGERFAEYCGGTESYSAVLGGV